MLGVCAITVLVGFSSTEFDQLDQTDKGAVNYARENCGKDYLEKPCLMYIRSLSDTTFVYKCGPEILIPDYEPEEESR